MQPTTGTPLPFKTTGGGKPRNIELVPLFGLHDRRYTVYFDTFTNSEWQQKEPE